MAVNYFFVGNALRGLFVEVIQVLSLIFVGVDDVGLEPFQLVYALILLLAEFGQVVLLQSLEFLLLAELAVPELALQQD